TVAMVTLEDIYANYSGVDQPEQIRNFIIDAYNGWETDFVLLAGDASIIPLRQLLVPGNAPDLIDSDKYYQALDGDFNADGDGYYGEYSGDNPDLISDVYLGRAGIDGVAHMSNFVYKTISYDNSIHDPYHYNALMVGEQIDGQTWSKPALDIIRNQHFATDPNFQVDTLYEYDQAWDTPEIIAAMNSDTYAVYNHLGHSNGGIVMQTHQDEYDAQLTNENFSFIYSQGCWPGYLGGGAVAEHLTTFTRHGAAAGMFNSTYGWYYSGWSSGPSQDLNVQFWDAMFGEGINQIGGMNADSHTDNIGSAGTWYYLAVIYGTTIFGDPSLEIISYDVSVDDVDLGAAYQRKPYSATMQPIHGTGPFSWAVTAGALPDGLTMDSAGVISGTPTKLGEYTFTVEVTDSVPNTATREFTMNVAQEPDQVVGQVFLDLDGDGQHDTGEVGLNGWTVQLVDLAGGAVVGTTVTASSDLDGDTVIDPETETGIYFFTNVAPGNYEIRQTLESGFEATTFHQGGSRTFAAETFEGATTIVEFDPNTGVALNTFGAPQPVLTAGLQGLAVGPDSLFYVDSVDMLSPVLWELDMDTGAILDTDALTFGAVYSIQGLAYCGGELFIQYLPGKVAVWDPATDAFVREIVVAGNISGGLTGADDIGLLYASNNVGEVLVISPDDGAVLMTLTPGVGALDGGLSYDGSDLIGVSQATAIAHRIDRLTGADLGSYTINLGFGKITGLGGDALPAPVGGVVAVTIAGGQYIEVAGLGNELLGVAGDMDADGDVDVNDIDILCANLGGTDPVCDLDDGTGTGTPDGIVDASDLDYLVTSLVELTDGSGRIGTEMGDYNLDGQINATDLAVLAGGFGGSGGWAVGDSNGDGLVNATDLAILAANFGYIKPAAPAPLSLSIAVMLGAP
ncbi:MAG: C25 family cysteine peptidase, partial [Planctomycetota bacterium]